MLFNASEEANEEECKKSVHASLKKDDVVLESPSNYLTNI